MWFLIASKFCFIVHFFIVVYRHSVAFFYERSGWICGRHGRDNQKDLLMDCSWGRVARASKEERLFRKREFLLAVFGGTIQPGLC